MAEIPENQDNPGYVSPLSTAGPDGKSLTRKEQAEAYRRARAIQQGAYQERRFLSDPPAGYKIPASTAPIGELGETEREKEQRRKEGATVKGSGKRWWQVWKR